MCLRCQAPNNKYIIRDRKSGWLLCEECGFAVKTFTPDAYDDGFYIWNINSEWPAFNSFQDLINKVLLEETHVLPSCKALPNIPSKFLCFCFENLPTHD